MRLRAVLLVDENLFEVTDPDFRDRNRPHDYEAEFSVADALRSLGHQVTGVPATTNVTETITRIQGASPDFVFNMVEQIGGRREYDGVLVQILSLLNIPYTGASAESLMLCRNKQVAKLIVAAAGVDAPRGVVVHTLDFSLPRDFTFPVIAKPLYCDGSEGVTSGSYIKSSTALERRLPQLARWLPLLVEEYAPGREIIVTISGTTNPTVDSICELFFPHTAPVKFASAQAKFDEVYRQRFGICYKTPAVLDKPTARLVSAMAKRAYTSLAINAYAKIEFRVHQDRAIFLEANPNSQLSRFAHSSDFRSIGYEKFIRKIVRMALSRARV